MSPLGNVPSGSFDISYRNIGGGIDPEAGRLPRVGFAVAHATHPSAFTNSRNVTSSPATRRVLDRPVARNGRGRGSTLRHCSGKTSKSRGLPMWREKRSGNSSESTETAFDGLRRGQGRRRRRRADTSRAVIVVWRHRRTPARTRSHAPSPASRPLVVSASVTATPPATSFWNAAARP